MQKSIVAFQQPITAFAKAIGAVQKCCADFQQSVVGPCKRQRGVAKARCRNASQRDFITAAFNF